MTSEKVDVSELLLQLKELKQKKACHMKKLKRKLGRAVVLKQSKETISYGTAESGKNSLSQAESSEARNALSVLNCSNVLLSSISIEENEQKYCNENKSCFVNKINTSTSASVPKNGSTSVINDIYSQPGSTRQQLPCKDLIDQEFESSKQNSRTNSCVENDRNYVKVQTVRPCLKRSADDSQIEELTCDNFCSKKKSKIKEISNELKEESGTEKHISYQELCQHEDIVLEDDLKPTEKVEKSLENICADSKNTCYLLTKQLDRKEKGRAELSLDYHISLTNELEVKDTTGIVLNNSLSKASKTSFSEIPVEAGFEEDLDPNVTEVADTEQIIEPKFQFCVKNNEFHPDSVVFENQNISRKGETLHETDRNNSNGEIHLGALPVDFVSTEVGCVENHHLKRYTCIEQEITVFSSNTSKSIETFQELHMDVASFEEVSTEINPPTLTKSLLEIRNSEAATEDCLKDIEEEEPENLKKDTVMYSSSTKNLLDSFNCSFTDEEDSNSKLIDSEDLGKFMQDTEVEEDNFEQIINLHSSQIEEKMLSSPLKVNVASPKQISYTCQDTYFECEKKLPADVCMAESDVLTVPETELFVLGSYSQAKVDNSAQNINITTDNLVNFQNEAGISLSQEKVNPEKACNSFNFDSAATMDNFECSSNFLDSEQFAETLDMFEQYSEKDTASNLNGVTEFNTNSPDTENFLELTNYDVISAESKRKTLGSPICDRVTDNQGSHLDFECCLQSDIHEKVTQLKLSNFNNSYYLFIQHLTWLQVWRKETHCDWMKIFAHQVDVLHFQELCFTQSENYLVLVMLLVSDQKHCLQFLVFERESRLIKLMEHTHWFESSSKEEDCVFLCELDQLRFASAQGKDTFLVQSHSFSCLEESPRLLTVTLGSTADCLHSLCRIDKLPNALLGMSNNMLYVWHHLEARLVSSVPLQIADTLEIKNCAWATIENGLVFLIAICEEKECAKACQLLVANLATGFCETVSTYSLQPAQVSEQKSKNKNMTLAYSEPFILAASEKGSFLWTVDDEYCCASLQANDYSAIGIVPTPKDRFLIAVGCDEGCVNCYELKYC